MQTPARKILSVRNAVPVTLGGVTADFISFDNMPGDMEHVALRFGRPGGTPLVRLHSECLTGDVFGSTQCDCGQQLDHAIGRCAVEGGYILYLRQEGRGIGLYNKLDAYRLQAEQGLDTYAANHALGLPGDARDYKTAADMLAALGVRSLKLLSGNPDKARQIARHGIAVSEIIPTPRFTTGQNNRYLQAKQLAGHRYKG